MPRVQPITDLNTYEDKDVDPNPIPSGQENVYAGRAEFNAIKTILDEHATAINAMDAERRLLVTQAAHGFTLPSMIPIPVYFNGTNWVRASRAAAASLRSAYIVAIEDVNSFWLQIDGFHDLSGSHGLTPLSVYYLSDVDPAHTATKPTTGVIQALWEVLGDRLRLLSDPARVAQSVSTKQDIFFTPVVVETSRALTDADCGRVLWVDSTAGAVELTVPASLSAGFSVTIYKVDASANDVSAIGSGGLTLEGNPAVVVAGEWITSTRWAGISVIRHSAATAIAEGRN